MDYEIGRLMIQIYAAEVMDEVWRRLRELDVSLTIEQHGQSVCRVRSTMPAGRQGWSR